jgi:monoterpene epsilon-lactone hydrolase
MKKKDQNEARASFTGRLTRETVRLALSLPFARGERMLRLMNNFTKKNSKWTALPGFELERFPLENCSAELLSPGGNPGKVILHLHGGSFVVGMTNIFRNSALKYARLCGASVLTVDYRTAPDYVHPAALDDARNAWDFLLARGFRPENIAVAGDSAGGNLALALTESLRDEGCALPRAVVCMSPWADLAGEGSSYKHNLKNDPTFGSRSRDKTGRCGGLTTIYAGNTELHDRYLSPVYADFTGFPPILLQAGSCEILLSDSETIFRKALAAGVDARLTVYRGMFHDFQLYGSYFPESRAAWSEVGSFIAEHLG